MLVESHAYAVACAAESYRRIDIATLDSLGTRMGEVGIVATLGAVSAEIDIFYTLSLEITLDQRFHLITCVVAAQTDRLVCFQY